MPVHVHADEEELFYVLDGEGLSWQDGRTYAVRAGDCVLHRPGAEAHTIVGAGDGLDVLAFSGGSDTGLTWLPRAQGVVERPALAAPRRPQPVRRRGGGRPARGARARGAAPADHRRARRRAAEDFTGGGDVVAVRRELGDALGSTRTGVGHLVVAPGALSGPPHCHAAEEEMFVVLDGDGTLLLGDEEHPCARAASSRARPAPAWRTRSAPATAADAAGLRHARAQRHRLLPALGQGRAARDQGALPRDAGRVLGR